MRPTLRAALGAALSALLAAAAAAQEADLEALAAAAREEGMLTTIALPHSWCNYGAVIEGFKARYPGIVVNELNPDGSSADELEAVRANRGNTGPQAPDVLDIGLSFGPAAAEEGLLAPYKVSTWDTIPDDAKDPDGLWYGDYYGVVSFAVNTDLVHPVPASFADLLGPAYAGQVSLAGDPRTAQNAALAVMAAGVARGAAPGEASADAGLGFFAELARAGNLVPVDGSTGTLAQGTTPILIDWDYNNLSRQDELAGNPPVEVVVPGDGTVAGLYVQAISAHAPHPNAARLWMEYLYSDEGQLHWLSGYCHPIRFDDLVARGVVPQEMMDALPPAEGYARAVFPSLADSVAHATLVQETWTDRVGADIGLD